MISTLSTIDVTSVDLEMIDQGVLFRPFGLGSDIIYLRTHHGAVCVHRTDNRTDMLGAYADVKKLRLSCGSTNCSICPPGEIITLSN